MTHATEHDPLIAQALHDHFVALGRKGGLTKSANKKRASKLNGKLGGWPKGRKRGPKTNTTKQ